MFPLQGRIWWAWLQWVLLWVLCCGSNCATVLGGDVLDYDVEWPFAPCPTEFRAPNSASKCLWRPVLHLARGLQQSAGNLTTCPHSWTISWAAGLQCDSVLKSFNFFSRKKNCFLLSLLWENCHPLPPGKPCFCLRRQVWVWATQLWWDFRRKHLVSWVKSLISASWPFHPSSLTPLNFSKTLYNPLHRGVTWETAVCENT